MTGGIRVASADAESWLFARITDTVHRVDGLPALRALLDSLPQQGRASSPVALDLMGHSTRDHHYLRIGPTAIDMLDPVVARWFEDVADSGLLDRLGVTAVRLLGCETAGKIGGQRTIKRLAHVLGVEVWGTKKPISKSHYGPHGFAQVFTNLLVESSSLSPQSRSS